MTTIAMVAAGSWSVSIGGGWIVLMLVGMALCFVFMLGFMWLMGGGRGWAMCGHHAEEQRRGALTPDATRKPTRSHLVSERSER